MKINWSMKARDDLPPNFRDFPIPMPHKLIGTFCALALRRSDSEKLVALADLGRPTWLPSSNFMNN